MMTLPTPAMIIFDLDGTLVDTEVLHILPLKEMFLEMNHVVDIEAFHLEISGTTFEHTFNYIRNSLEIVTFDNDKENEYRLRFAKLLESEKASITIPHALETLKSLSHALPIAIATNGEPDLSDIKLRSCGFFEAIPDLKVFTKELVKNPKPAPDLYLYVAEQYGVAPKDCWVVEDTVTGATAGIAAGMTVIGFIGCAHDKDKARQDLLNAGCVMVLESYDQFPPLSPSFPAMTASSGRES